MRISDWSSDVCSSDLLSSIIDELEKGGRFAFVGKPCDISALRELAKSDAWVDQQIPLKLSFFCGGIPSHAGADRIIAEMRLEGAPLSELRYRCTGWPGHDAALTPDGRAGGLSYGRCWGYHLTREGQFRL